jgi:hypothetical protein
MTNRNDRFAYVKLFDTVGERFSSDYTDKTGWMYSHQWTTAMREEFVVWLAAELVKRGIYVADDVVGAQMEAMFFTHKNGWQINDKPRKAA